MSAPFPSALAAAPSFLNALALPIERLEILAFDGQFFARVQSGNWQGVVALNDWAPALASLWQTVVFPFWLGRDAQDVAGVVEAIGRANHPWASAPFWSAVAAVELASWDLLGRAHGKSVAQLLCDKPRRKVPLYLSNSRGDAKSEMEILSEAIDETGAKAVKFGIGERDNRDEQSVTRDRERLELARQKWGEKLVIYADANGSFDPDKAIEVGAMLHQYQVAWFENPCDWEDFEATRAVAAGVPLPIAGGARESSFPRWKWLLEHCALDVAQPDLSVNGGLWRSRQIADFAANLNVSTTPHSPHRGLQALPALHFAAALRKPAPFLEWDARADATPSWAEALPQASQGAVAVPTGAGWGAVYDDEIWNKAEILAALCV